MASPSHEAPTSTEPIAGRCRILTFTDYYLPGYKGGGPIRTIANLVEHLGDQFDFRIVTLDRDLGDREPYRDIRAGTWQAVGKAMVLYTSPRRRRIGHWWALLRQTEFDLLYLNGFFSRATIRLLVARRGGLIPDRPVLLAPRGELSPGALGLKPIRKRLFLSMARRLGLLRGLTWHASTDLERTEILYALGLHGRSTEAGDGSGSTGGGTVEVGVDLPPRGVSLSPSRASKAGGRARVVFISRIARKKNLHYALRVLSRVTGPVVFDVYGPVEDLEYWSECEALMRRLPSNVTAAYRGEVHPTSVSSRFAEYDLFLFPTLSENFGHVVLEALMSGCPVLMSDTTPWRDLAARKAGWDLSLDAPDAFVRTLQQVVDMDPREHEAWRDGAAALGRFVGSDAGAVEANRELFARCCRRGRDGGVP